MSFLLPNPPVAPNQITEGLQNFYAWGPRLQNNMFIGVAAGNCANLQAVGTQNPAPVYSTLNAVTRIPREVRNASAGSSNDASFGFANPFGVGGTGIVFPGQANDAGFKMSITAGLDAAAGSVALAQLIFGALSSTVALPSSSGAITLAAATWIGMYNEGAGGGLRFGYKNPGTTTITRLDSGQISSSLYAPYTAWRIELLFSPVGPTVFYDLSSLNSAGSQFTPVLSGSTTAYAPGRVTFAPNISVRTGAAGNSTDVFLANAAIIGYPLGRLSL